MDDTAVILMQSSKVTSKFPVVTDHDIHRFAEDVTHRLQLLREGRERSTRTLEPHKRRLKSKRVEKLPTVPEWRTKRPRHSKLAMVMVHVMRKIKFDSKKVEVAVFRRRILRF